MTQEFSGHPTALADAVLHLCTHCKVEAAMHEDSTYEESVITRHLYSFGYQERFTAAGDTGLSASSH